MVSFWQLSGPDSHFHREWNGPSEQRGNEGIVAQLFAWMSGDPRRDSDSKELDFVLGMTLSGASHILIPTGSALPASLRRKYKEAYPASTFAALSPIRVDRPTLLNLLEDRQVISKNTAASKKKGDNSKANGGFWNGPPRPMRAAFEHGRCLWKILHQELRPQAYGLPDSPWSAGLDIVSLGMNFWFANKTTFLDAGITSIHLPANPSPNPSELYTRYIKSTDYEVLRNPSHSMENFQIPENWDTEEMDGTHIGTKIKKILESHSHPDSFPPAPLVLLVHDYATVKASLGRLGIQTSMWKDELKELLGYHLLDHGVRSEGTKSEPRYHLDHGIRSEGTKSEPKYHLDHGIRPEGTKSEPRHSRDRSYSPPRAGYSNEHSSRRMRSPVRVKSYAPVYVVDTAVMFKAVTGSANHPRSIRPVDVFNKITNSDESDHVCGGSDSNYIMQSWMTMVTGASIDEQKALYTKSSVNQQNSGPDETEEASLFQQAESEDIFNDGNDSDDY